MIEWTLVTPRRKEFVTEQKRTVLRQVEKPVGHPENPEGDPGNPKRLPIISFEEVEIEDDFVYEDEATCARLSGVSNDRVHERMFVRFYYGKKVGGKFVPAIRDDGIVFSGPTYVEHDFHLEDEHDAETMLNKCAQILGWDGAANAVAG